MFLAIYSMLLAEIVRKHPEFGRFFLQKTAILILFTIEISQKIYTFPNKLSLHANFSNGLRATFSPSRYT
jgi:hypothetical protein